MDPRCQFVLDAAFPAATDAIVVRGIQEGILLADAVIDNEQMLRTVIGLDLRGHLRRAGVLFRLHGMATSGDLPFECDMARMPKGGWHFVEMRSGGLKAHICRPDGPTLFPDDTPIRQDERLANQGDLFRKPVSIDDVRDKYAWLTYGAGDSGALSHVCWGMPSAKADVWLARTNVLLRVAAAEASVVPERPKSEIKLRFREHIEKSLSEADEEQPAGQ